MRRLFASFMLALLAPLAWAQDEPQSEPSLAEKRDAKLKDAWLAKKADWTHDYDQARERAQKEGKLIFAYFTRSYAY